MRTQKDEYKGVMRRFRQCIECAQRFTTATAITQNAKPPLSARQAGKVTKRAQSASQAAEKASMGSHVSMARDSHDTVQTIIETIRGYG